MILISAHAGILRVEISPIRFSWIAVRPGALCLANGKSKHPRRKTRAGAHHKWRCRESNPGPTIAKGVFSGRSSLIVVFGSRVPHEPGPDEPIYVGVASTPVANVLTSGFLSDAEV